MPSRDLSVTSESGTRLIWVLLTSIRDTQARPAAPLRSGPGTGQTRGLLRKGMSRSNIEAVEAEYPNCGFHESLLRLAKDCGGSTLVGGGRVIRGIVTW